MGGQIPALVSQTLVESLTASSQCRGVQICMAQMNLIGNILLWTLMGPNLHADCKELGTQPSHKQVLTNQHRLFMGVANNFLEPNR